MSCFSFVSIFGNDDFLLAAALSLHHLFVCKIHSSLKWSNFSTDSHVSAMKFSSDCTNECSSEKFIDKLSHPPSPSTPVLGRTFRLMNSECFWARQRLGEAARVKKRRTIEPTANLQARRIRFHSQTSNPCRRREKKSENEVYLLAFSDPKFYFKNRFSEVFDPFLFKSCRFPFSNFDDPSLPPFLIN